MHSAFNLLTFRILCSNLFFLNGMAMCSLEKQHFKMTIIIIISMLCPWARHLIGFASVGSAVKWVPGGNIHEGCLFNAMSCPDEIAFESQSIFSWSLQ